MARLDLEKLLQKNVTGGAHDATRRVVQPLAVRALRLVVNNVPAVPQRRRMPRRQTVAGCAFERRGADRRQARPGLDGLLRTVLSDSWR